jgi:hypothetical protein
MHFFISVAHSSAAKGASFVKNKKRYTERDLSLPISQDVVESLNDGGYEATLVNGSTLRNKTDIIKRQLKVKKIDVGNYLALEIHFNSARAKGTCVLYRTGSEFSEECAEIMQDVLLEELKRKAYCKARGRSYMKTDGVIPFPSDFRHTKSGKQFKLGFFEYLRDNSDGDCPAIIIEVDGIWAGPWAANHIEDIAQAIVVGLTEIEASYEEDE